MDFQVWDRYEPSAEIALVGLVEAACMLEATAPKLGNVSPGVPFQDMSYRDFVASAKSVRESFQNVQEPSLGKLVIGAIRATRSRVGCNTNLGLVLLLAPLYLSAREMLPVTEEEPSEETNPWRPCIHRVLNRLDAQDACDVFEAIRMANPGGLGQVSEGDVHAPPTRTLLEAMRLAADRDRIANAYADGFSECLAIGRRLIERRCSGMAWLESVCWIQLELLSERPDSLIVRKLGWDAAKEIQSLALSIRLETAWGSRIQKQRLRELDRYLRSDGNRRNPGTTADLIGGGLFVALVDLRRKAYPASATLQDREETI